MHTLAKPELREEGFFVTLFVAVVAAALRGLRIYKGKVTSLSAGCAIAE